MDPIGHAARFNAQHSDKFKKKPEDYKMSTQTLGRMFRSDEEQISFSAGLLHTHSSLFRTNEDVKNREISYIAQMKTLADKISSLTAQEESVELNSTLTVKLTPCQDSVTITSIEKKWYGTSTTIIGVFLKDLLIKHGKTQKDNVEKYQFISFFGEEIGKSNERFVPPQKDQSFHFFSLGSGHTQHKKDSILTQAHTQLNNEKVSTKIVDGPSAYLGRGFDSNVMTGVREVLTYIGDHLNNATINIKLLGHSRGSSETIAIYNIVNWYLQIYKDHDCRGELEKLFPDLTKFRDIFINKNIPQIHYSFFLLDPVRGGIDIHMNTSSLTKHIRQARENDKICIEIVHSTFNEGIQNTSGFDISHILVEDPSNTFIRVHNIDANHGHIEKFASDDRGNNAASSQLLEHFLSIKLKKPDNLPKAKKPLLKQSAHIEADSNTPTPKRRLIKEIYLSVLKKDFNLTEDQLTELFRQNNNLQYALDKGLISRARAKEFTFAKLKYHFVDNFNPNKNFVLEEINSADNGQIIAYNLDTSTLQMNATMYDLLFNVSRVISSMPINTPQMISIEPEAFKNLLAALNINSPQQQQRALVTRSSSSYQDVYMINKDDGSTIIAFNGLYFRVNTDNFRQISSSQALGMPQFHLEQPQLQLIQIKA